MHRSSSTIAIVVLLCVAYPGVSRPNPPADYDESNEKQSDFWQSFIDGPSLEYLTLVRRGIGLIQTSPDSAIVDLSQARDMMPMRIEAHYGLGLATLRLLRFNECARHLRHVAEHDPTFVWEEHAGAPWSLQFELGFCLSHSGHFQEAVTSFKQAIDNTDKSLPRIYKHLGDAYMAMGLLEQAILSYQQALARGSRSWNFALAIALDRNQAKAKSMKALDEAISRDPNLKKLRDPKHLFVPNNDRHAYLGLAYQRKGQRQRSLFHFKWFLSQATSTLWTKHIAQHIKDLEKDTFGDDAIVEGKHALTTSEWTKKIRYQKSAFKLCLEDVPSFIAEISITRWAPKKTPTGQEPPPGITIVPLETIAENPDKSRTTLPCLQEAADQIKFPTPSDRYLRLRFVLSKPPQSP